MEAHDSLHALEAQAGASFIPYGPPANGAAAIELVETFGEYELEYAAIRKGAGLFHHAQRGWVLLSGEDRLSLLQRLMTQDVSKLKPGQGTRGFLLDRTGRIQADALVLQGDKQTRLIVDWVDAASLTQALVGFCFTEDVQIAAAGEEHVHLSLYGPAAAALLTTLADKDVSGMAALEHRMVALAGEPCLVYRRDETASPGLHLLVPTTWACRIYELLAQAELTAERSATARRVRSIGWLAYNTARIEAGTPLYHVDFGPDTIPAETSLLDQTVSFNKGCYIGQEVVARLRSLGHPRRVLVGLKFSDDLLPLADSPVRAQAQAEQVVGAITSSTLSPMLGGIAIALAMVKWGLHAPGTSLWAAAQGGPAQASVQGLIFLPGPG